MFHMQGLASDPPNPVEPQTVQSSDAEVAQNHHVICSGRNDDSIGSTDQYGSNLTSTTVNGDGFGDCDCTEPTWIQGINLAPDGSLGNSSGKGLAGSSAAAWISVIPNARNPSPRCLSIPKRGSQQNKSQQFQQIHFAHRFPLIRFSNTQVLPCRLTRPILSRQAGGRKYGD